MMNPARVFTRYALLQPDQKNWGGVISLKNPAGVIVDYPFESSYYVGEPNVVVSPTAMNVMYKGIQNPIDVSVPGVSPEKIRVRVVNGTVTTQKVKNSKGENFRGNWAVNPYNRWPECPGNCFGN